MNVVAYSRWMTSDIAAALGIGRAESAEDVARMSDVVSIHVSLNPDTKGLINEQFVDALKPGAIFVNTSRAEVIDQSALLAAVKSKGVIVGLDVFDGEPTSAEGTYEGELRNAENVYCTHHIGASTEQAQEAIAAETVRIVREYKLTGMVPNVVNLGKAEVATHLLVVRHLDKVGVLAHVLAVLKEEGASVQEMENIVLGGAKAAIAQITIDKEPSEESLHQMRLYPDIFDVTCFTLHK
jgi:D-3-phosphoglycerate dehydrogenase